MLSKIPDLRDEGTWPSLWPVPIPYPEAFRSSVSSNWRKRRLSLQVAVLDWLFLGKPAACPPSLRIGSRLSARQWKMVLLLESLAEDMNSVFCVTAQDMGRTAAKTELHDAEIGALHRACNSLDSQFGGYSVDRRVGRSGNGSVDPVNDGLWGDVVGSIDAADHVAAKPIVADRIKFGDAPGFDPLPYLDFKTAAMYECPQNFFKSEPDIPPKVSVRASYSEKMALFRRMAACGRLSAFPQQQVDHMFSSGLFAVGKNLEFDRLIMDCRPANGREQGLNHWTACMASATVLSQIELGDAEELRMSGEDVQDYFYQFKISKDRCVRNSLVGLLTEAELSKIFDGGVSFDGPGYVCLDTMAMGDLCACEFAQCSHLSVLPNSGQLSPSELILMHSPLPRSPLSIGIVIDDLVLLERVLKNNGAHVSSASKRLAPIKAAYQKVGLPVNEKKEFVDAEKGSFWGCEIDGIKGILRPNSARLWPVIMITVRIVVLGLTTIGLLESLLGSWVSIFMYRRRLLSLMSLSFEVVSAGLQKGHVVRLSDELRDELMSMVVCGPLSYVNLRARTAATLRATDSSGWGAAAVHAEVPATIAREAFRHSLSKSTWTHLLPPLKAWMKQHGELDPGSELPDGEAYSTHPLWAVLARGLTFVEGWRRPHPRQTHINCTELGAHLREESRLATVSTSMRYLYGLDSQVALGSLIKGRSASKPLNNMLQRSLGPCIGSDLYSGLGFFPSSLNRADAPTRGATPPGPDIPLPEWWESAASGDFTLFDEWLLQQEDACGLSASFRQFDFESLGYKELPRLQTGKHLHKASHYSRRDSDKKGLQQPSPLPVSALEAPMPSRSFEPAATDVNEEFNTLPAEAVAILASFNENQVWWPKKSPKKFTAPGALDLFTGRGGVARALLKLGAPFVVTFEWKRSASEDLLQDDNRKRIFRLVELRAVEVIGLAVICASFSMAITPPVRSPRFPRGVPWAPSSMKQKISEGNSHADFAADLLDCAEDHGVTYWLENPDSSYLWQQKRLRRFRNPGGSNLFRCDYCRFGTLWRKRTRVATSASAIQGLRCMCQCKRPHITLRGNHPIFKKPWTAIAEPYPKAFADLIGLACSIEVGWTTKKLNIAGCCRSVSLRVGEAKNPGPRVRRTPRHFSLETAPVQTSVSLALGDKCWKSFTDWAKSFLSGDPLLIFLEVPLFLVHAIRRFGDLEFMKGGSLLYYRHLILTAQRKVPSAKPLMHIAWDLATRWEAVEPTVHRTPIPLVMVQAMIAVGWNLGWKRWCGVTCIAFFGIARVGEVISCRRSDLLLPYDLMDDSNQSAFVLLKRSKTSYRQAARVQHLKINDLAAVRLNISTGTLALMSFFFMDHLQCIDGGGTRFFLCYMWTPSFG